MFFLQIVFFSLLSAEYGEIVGEVIDIDTHQPLIGANVIINESEFGASCNNQGKFHIKKIPVGSYTLKASMIGYSDIQRVNVSVFSDRQTPIKFYLSSSTLKGEMVIVKSDFFQNIKDGIVSSQIIDHQEIRSDPVGVYDAQMMIHSLPSVVTATDQNNEIIVRGGGPGENLFIMDQIEIPNPNHFGEVGSGGGPVNIVNTEFVERIDFYAGGFPSIYGDKQSSVMDIKLREGNYNQFEYNLEMSMAGLGFFFEGPIVKEKVSYMSSYRKSFIKYLIKSAGLTAVPEYWNTQHKIVYNLSETNKLIINLIGGADKVSIEDENRPDLKGAENVDYNGYQYTVGLTYKSLFSKKGYFLFSIGKSLNSWEAYVYKKEISEVDTFFQRDNIESDNLIKFDYVYKKNSNLEFSFGINAKLGRYTMQEILDDDSVFIYHYPNILEIDLSDYDNYYDLIEKHPEYAGKVVAQKQNYIYKNIGFINFISDKLWKYAAYAQTKFTNKSWTFITGLRYDRVPFNNTTKLSPRLSLSYLLSSFTKLNVAFGIYYQTPYYWMFMNPNNIPKLKHSYTKQYIMGLEHYFKDDFKGSAEIYYKSYFNKPIQRSDITLDLYDSGLGFVDIGEGIAKGFELFLQKKYASSWYGTLSYSYSITEGVDYREGKEGYYSWDYDNQSSLTVVGGYKFNFRDSKRYNIFKNSKIFPYIAWIPFMISDQLELSFRYRYSRGLPYTPKSYDFYYRRWYIDPNQSLNSVRYNYYSRLDIMVLRKFNFKKINIITFLDIQNIFNKDNEWERVYLENGTYEMSYQYKQIPVGGIIIEF